MNPIADWEFETADTQRLTHAIHRYSGKFIPQIPAQVIRDHTQPGDTVLDFFCGSGTTLLEAALNGRRSVGIDVNPLAILIAKVKTTPIRPNELKQLVERFENAQYSRAKGDPKLKDPWFTKWFDAKILSQLVAIHAEISSLRKANHRNLAMVAFSDIIRRVSNAHSGYPNVMFDKNKKVTADCARIFLKRLREVSECVATLHDVPDISLFKPEIFQGSSENMPLSSGSVDAIISHPPYVASVPYAEYGALSLKWLGFEPLKIDKTLTGGGRQKADVLSRFQDSYGAIIREGHRVLKPKGIMFLMVGNPTIRGSVFRLDEFTVDLCERSGFKLMAIRNRTGQNRRANKMGTESLLFFQK